MYPMHIHVCACMYWTDTITNIHVHVLTILKPAHSLAITWTRLVQFLYWLAASFFCTCACVLEQVLFALTCTVCTHAIYTYTCTCVHVGVVACICLVSITDYSCTCTMYIHVHIEGIYRHTCILYMYVYLLEVTKQQTCMKRSYCAMY